MLSVLLLAVLVLPFSKGEATSTWAKSYGGLGDDDVFRAIEISSNGGYLIAGHTDSSGAGNKDLWLIKINEEGAVEWQKTYGGIAGDVARSIRETADGGHIVVGFTNSFTSGSNDVWVIKLNSDGNIEWQKAYGAGGADVAHAVQQTSDGGYVVAGYTKSFGASMKDYFILKLSATGEVQWQKRYGGIKDDVIRYVVQLSDGGYLAAGFTHSFGKNGDILVIKLDANGNLIWQKTYGGSKFEEPGAILEMPDGYIIMEQTASFSNSTDGWVFKLDVNGKILWQKTYGGTGFDEISAAQITSDGGFIAVGETTSFGAGPEDFWILKFDADGNLQWEKRHGGSNADEAESVALTPDGGFVVVGHTFSFGASGHDIWVTSLDSDGNFLDPCTPDIHTSITKSSVKNTNAIPKDISLTVKNTTVKIKNTAAIVLDTDVTIRTQCGITVNLPPVATDDNYSTSEDVALEVSSPGVLANDADTNGDSMTAALVTGPANGILTLNADGGFIYTPNLNFHGEDSFTYKASDGSADSDVAIVSITVESTNDAPEANDDEYSTDMGVVLDISEPGILANDTDVEDDALSATLVSDPINGELVLNADGSFTYTPGAEFVGEDSFTYIVNDGTADSTIATVTINVNPPP